MKWPVRNFKLTAVWIALAAGLVAGGWSLERARRLAEHTRRMLDVKQAERARLVRESPARAAGGEGAIMGDLAEVVAVLAERRARLSKPADDRFFRRQPTTSTEAYFELAGFVEKVRALAVQAQVDVRRDEYLGFASHATAGPEAGLIATVFRQQIAIEHLVGILLESRPNALLGVQRERPLAGGRRQKRTEPGPGWSGVESAVSGATGQPGDFFGPAELLLVRTPGRTESDAFRLEFTGKTGALRRFLNGLAEGGLPVIVRSVEVEPLAAQKAPVVLSETAARTSRVTQTISRFTVVVEVVDLVEGSGAPLS